MARIRTIKPEFFTSEDIVSLTPLARLLYIALWCEADKEGRMTWKPVTFKMRYLPGDNCDIHALCKEILDGGLVELYGEGLAFIPKFADHQHVNPRESASKLPDHSDISRVPTRADASLTRAYLDLHAQGGREGKGREGEGARVEDATNPTSGFPPPDENLDLDNLPEKQAPATPSMAGAICVALKSVGMGGVNPGSQNLKTLIDKGADIGLFVEMGRECVANKKPFSYLLAAVNGRMNDAQTMANEAIAKGSAPVGGVLPGAI